MKGKKQKKKKKKKKKKRDEKHKIEDSNIILKSSYILSLTMYKFR